MILQIYFAKSVLLTTLFTFRQKSPTQGRDPLNTYAYTRARTSTTQQGLTKWQMILTKCHDKMAG